MAAVPVATSHDMEASNAGNAAVNASYRRKLTRDPRFNLMTLYSYESARKVVTDVVEKRVHGFQMLHDIEMVVAE